MDKLKATRDIITAALPHVPFDGWGIHTLERAAVEAGYEKFDVIRVFPNGAIDAVNAYIALADEEMKQALAEKPIAPMKIREKITLAVRLRLKLHAGQKEAVRRALAVHMLPIYSHHGLRTLYNTVDAIWFAIGDTSTDFNFYSKRATLAGVYSATLLYWLNDESEGSEATWKFLDRRIENVMQFEKLKYKMRSYF